MRRLFQIVSRLLAGLALLRLLRRRGQPGRQGQRGLTVPTDTQRLVTVQGVPLWVSVQGQGNVPAQDKRYPLLLLMGFGGNLELWRPLRRALGTYETIALDLPGVGGSPPTWRPRRAAEVTRMLIALLDMLGYDRVDVLGVSMGGGLAQELAHQAPDRVRRVVLCATASNLLGTVSTPGELLARLRDTRLPGSLEAVLAAVFGGTVQSTPQLRDDLTYALARRATLRGILYQLYAVVGWSSRSWLATIKMPALVMAGDGDYVVPLRSARDLAGRIPGATLYVVRGAGHLFLGFQVEESARVVLDFLR